MNSQEQPITFKVIFEEDDEISSSHKDERKTNDESQEIRKVVFNQVPDFKQLCDKLISLGRERLCHMEKTNCGFFPPKYVRIKYIDKDGDKITIGCDADLQNVIEEQVVKSIISMILKKRL